MQLLEKLVSLESQVSATVQSTVTAVNATVGAVQETVETVTGAAGNAVQSVNNAFDFRRQINRHPFLVVGGAVAVGYLAVELIAGSKRKSEQTSEAARSPSPLANHGGDGNGKSAVESAAIAAAYEAGRKSSSWHHLQDLATRSLIGVVQEIASRALPQLLDSFTGNRTSAPVSRSDNTGERQRSPQRQASSEAAPRLRVASSESVRSGKAF
jgi:hypothetical protein